MKMQQQDQNFTERARVFLHDNYRNITIQIPIIIGVLATLLALVLLLTYGVELERLTWMERHYSPSNALYLYFKRSSEYIFSLGLLSIFIAIISFVTAFIFDRREK